MPLLSIITVNLNNAPGLRKTIESVVGQVFHDFEYIVIDGGSTDGSIKLLSEFSNNITFWLSEPDNGIYHAMNKGIQATKGKYLQFLNSGDWFVDENILQKIFISNYDEDILYGDVNYEYEDKVLKSQKIGCEKEITLAYFYNHMFPHQAAFIKKQLFTSGLYDENLKIVADWKFFIDRIVFKNCSIRKLNLIIVNYNMSGISNQSEYLELHDAEREKVISQLVPERIARDYESLILFSDSPLLKHMPYLHKTYGFHRFVEKIVGGLIKIYDILKLFKRS